MKIKNFVKQFVKEFDQKFFYSNKMAYRAMLIFMVNRGYSFYLGEAIVEWLLDIEEIATLTICKGATPALSVRIIKVFVEDGLYLTCEILHTPT